MEQSVRLLLILARYLPLKNLVLCRVSGKKVPFLIKFLVRFLLRFKLKGYILFLDTLYFMELYILMTKYKSKSMNTLRVQIFAGTNFREIYKLLLDREN